MLHVLPHELWLSVLSELDAPTLRIVAATCQAFHQLVVDSAPLQLIIELALGALRREPLHPASANLTATLNSVRSSRSAWLSLRSYSRTRIEIPYKPGSLYELSGGYFFCSVASGDSQRAVDIGYIKLPQHDSDSSQVPTWKHILVKEHISDFAIDVDQDLFVFVEIIPPTDSSMYIGWGLRIHFRRLSDGRSHPAAKEPHVDFAMRQAGHVVAFQYAAVTIQIVATHVAILFRTYLQQNAEADSVAVWDWQTGHCKGSIGSEIASEDEDWLNMDHFVILDSNKLLVHRINPPQLDVLVFDTGAPGPSLRPLYTHAVFQLHKKMLSNASVLRSEPASFSRPPWSSPANPYGADPSCSIISFSIPWAHGRITLTSGSEKPPKSFIGTRATFLRYIDTDLDHAHRGPGAEPLIVSWKNWSAEMLWDIPGSSPQWITHTYGTRHVVQVPESPENPENRMSFFQVMDFNETLARDMAYRHEHDLPLPASCSANVRLDRGKDQQEDSRRIRWRPPWRRHAKVASNQAMQDDGHLEDEEDEPGYGNGNGEILDGRVVVITAHSKQPSPPACVQVKSRQTFRYDGIMLDEARIIGLISDPDGSIRALDVFLIGPASDEI